MKSRGPDMPLVVVGNKTDLETETGLERQQTEALVGDFLEIYNGVTVIMLKGKEKNKFDVFLCSI